MDPDPVVQVIREGDASRLAELHRKLFQVSVPAF